MDSFPGDSGGDATRLRIFGVRKGCGGGTGGFRVSRRPGCSTRGLDEVPTKEEGQCRPIGVARGGGTPAPTAQIHGGPRRAAVRRARSRLGGRGGAAGSAGRVSEGTRPRPAGLPRGEGGVKPVGSRGAHKCAARDGAGQGLLPPGNHQGAEQAFGPRVPGRGRAHGPAQPVPSQPDDDGGGAEQAGQDRCDLQAGDPPASIPQRLGVARTRGPAATDIRRRSPGRPAPRAQCVGIFAQLSASASWMCVAHVLCQFPAALRAAGTGRAAAVSFPEDSP